MGNNQLSSLTTAQKAQLYRIYASKGYKDLTNRINRSNSFATGGSLPDHDPNNPYHYHDAKGNKVVISPEDWEANIGKPYFAQVEDAVRAEQAAYPEPEYEVNPSFVRDLRNTYRFNMGNSYQNYRNFNSALPEGYSFTDEGLIVDPSGNYYVQSGYRQSPRFTYNTDSPLQFTINKGKPIERNLTFYPVNMDKRVKAPLPVDRVMNVNSEREKAVKNYIETHATPRQRINYINSAFVSYLYPELATGSGRQETQRGINEAKRLGFKYILDNYTPNQFNSYLIGFTDDEFEKFKRDLWDKSSYLGSDGSRYISLDGDAYNEEAFFNPNWYVNEDNPTTQRSAGWRVGPNGPMGFQTRYIGGRPSNQEAEREAVISIDPLEKVRTFQEGGSLDQPPFVKRFSEGQRRAISTPEGNATHLLSVATDNNGAIVYPTVQPVDYNDSTSNLMLVDDDNFGALRRAIEHGDTLRFNTEEEALNYTENYKSIPFLGATLNNPPATVIDFSRGRYFQEGGHLFQDGGWSLDAISGPDRISNKIPVESSQDYMFRKFNTDPGNLSFMDRLRHYNYIFDNYNPQWKDVDIVNPETVSTSGKQARDFVLKYIGSPGYNRRTNLAAEEIAKLKEKIQRIPIEYTESPYDNALYNPRKKVIKVYSGLQPKPFGGLSYVIGHELGHAADVGQRNETFRHTIGNLNSHDSKDTERYADLMAFRQYLYESGIYDSTTGEPFTRDHLEKVKRAGYWNGENAILKENKDKSKPDDLKNMDRQYLRILNQMDEDALIRMMNTIAQNSTSQDTSHYAANGGSLGKITPYGQWQYPHQVTTIPSNNITMKGVNYPVLGVSDTGDIKMMYPNFDYLFNGNYVTEYPIHKFQDGGPLNRLNLNLPELQPQISVAGNTRYVGQPITDTDIDAIKGLPEGTTTLRREIAANASKWKHADGGGNRW